MIWDITTKVIKDLKKYDSEFQYFNLQLTYTQFEAAHKCKIELHQKASLAVKRTHIPAKLEQIMKLLFKSACTSTQWGSRSNASPDQLAGALVNEVYGKA